MGAEADILREKDILLADLQPINDPFKEKIDFVVSPLQSVSDHPELIRAKESGLLILSVPELVLRMAKDKIRLVFCNPRHPNRIMSMVLKALRKQNMVFGGITLICQLGLSLGLLQLEVNLAFKLQVFKRFHAQNDHITIPIFG